MRPAPLTTPRTWPLLACLALVLLCGVRSADGHLPPPQSEPQFALRPTSSEVRRDHETDHVDYDPGTPLQGLTRLTRSLGAGHTPAEVLAGLAPAARDRERFVEALGRALDLRHLPPATGFVALVDAEGQLRQLSARAEPTRFVRVGPGADQALRADVVDLPVTRRVETASGIVRRSVHQALEGSPHSDELVLALSDIFQWNIDLLVDPRAGDQLRLVYEVLRLGEVPADLPPFGRSPLRPGELVRIGRILATEYAGQVARSRAFWVSADGQPGGYYDEHGAPLQRSFLRSPLNYRRISSRFSAARMHPITHQVVPHHGVDFAAARGTPVVAAADGQVASTGWEGPLGRTIRIRHGGGYVTVYGHLDRMAPGLRTGAAVRQNQIIGFVGSTGRATGPHLHYTILHAGRPLDPLAFRGPEAAPIPGALAPDLARVAGTWSAWLDSGDPGDLPRPLAAPFDGYVALLSSGHPGA